MCVVRSSGPRYPHVLTGEACNVGDKRLLKSTFASLPLKQALIYTHGPKGWKDPRSIVDLERSIIDVHIPYKRVPERRKKNFSSNHFSFHD